MSAGLIVSLISIVGALVLAVRGLRSRQVSPSNRVLMAVAWLVIIVGVIFVIQTLGVERAP